MNGIQRFEKHEKLMRQMASANDVDLELEVQMGTFGQDEYWQSVLACTGCSDPTGCQKHLRDGRSGIPSFCRNAKTIHRFSENTPSSK